MKKGLKIGLVFGTLLMLTAVMFAGTASACWQYTGMYAGQDYENPVGLVKAVVNEPYLFVRYQITDSNWVIDDTHLWVGDCLPDATNPNDPCDLPRNKKGNLKVGHFPYDSDSPEVEYISPQEVHFKIPLADITDTEGDGHLTGDMLYIVAHAVVIGPGGSETSWADTNEVVFPGAGLHHIPGVSGWGLYFPFVIGWVPPS